MAIRVIIENYKTIKSLDKTIDGFVSIIGRNYVGKSAIISAIRACLKNRSGSSFIRRGCDYCSVRLIFDQPNFKMDIKRHWEDGNHHYVIDGETYHKVGTGSPPKPIIDAGLVPVRIGSKDLELFCSPQNHDLFLIHEQSSDYVTDFLARVFGLDSIYKAHSNVKRDLKSLNSRLKVRESDLRSAEDELNKLNEVPTLTVTKQVVLDLHSELVSKTESADKLESSLVESDRLLSESQLLSEVKSISTVATGDLDRVLAKSSALESLVSVSESSQQTISNLQPVLGLTKIEKQEGLQSSLDKASYLEKHVAEAETFSKRVTSLESVSGIKKVEEGGVSTLIKNSQQIESALRDASSNKKAYAELAPVSKLQPIELDPALKGKIEEVSNLGDALNEAVVLQKKLREYPKLPDALQVPQIDFTRSNDLYSELSKASRIKKEISETNSEIDLLKENLVRIKEELSEFKTCPTCGSSLEVNHVHN